MRPTFAELMQGLFYLALIIALFWFTSHAVTVLDGIDKRQQQSTLHHEKLMAQADQSLKDHTQFLREHQALLDRLPVR